MTGSPARAKKAEIDHVVVLMLENRSFDNLLGFLEYPGLSPLKVGSHPNPFEVDGMPPQEATVSEDGESSLPVDPPHSHASVMRQINGRPKAKMNGFAAEYYKKASGNEELPVVHWERAEGVALLLGIVAAAIAIVGDGSSVIAGVIGGGIALAGTVGVLWGKHHFAPRVDPAAVDDAPRIMRCMNPLNVPVLATLAREFAVCKRWHASVPGETWPNRNFVHAATSDGATDIEIGLYDSTTIFQKLHEAGKSWRVYHQGWPQVMAFRYVLDNAPGNFKDFAAFDGDVATDLPTYSFIEPCHHKGSAPVKVDS